MELFLVIWGILLVVQPVIGDCTVQSKSEEKYLKLLDKLKGKTVTVQDKKYEYKIAFCESISGQQKDVGVYQTDLAKPDKPPVIVGRMTATHIKVGTDWILLTYQNGSEYNSHCGGEARQAHIMMICDTKNLIGKYAIIEENNEKLSDCAYIFELETSAACTQSTVSPINGLSIGSIIVIITLCLIVAYILFGFIFNRFFIGAKGIEQFPNVSFWRDFGNLVADGCVLVFRTKPPQEPRSYKGLGDDQLGFDEDEERDDHMLPM